MNVEHIYSFSKILYYRHNHSLNINWYRKLTFSGRDLNYLSDNPITQKRAIVCNFDDEGLLLFQNVYHFA